MARTHDKVQNTFHTRRIHPWLSWLRTVVVLLLLVVTLSACAEKQAVEPGVEASPSPEVETDVRSSPEAEESPSAAIHPPAAAPDVDRSPQPEGKITLDDLTSAPDAYVGQTVTVDGIVDVVFSKRAFTIADDPVRDFNAIPIMTATEKVLDTAPKAGMRVLVSGEVRTFNLAEVEQEMGADLDDAALKEFEGQPAIVAKVIEVLEDAGVAPAITETPETD